MVQKIVSFSFSDTALYQASLKIRETVFIDEQQVERALEVENEEEAIFYLLLLDEKPVGTARWRKTSKGIKLERFAVLPEYRNLKLGTEILKRVLFDLKDKSEKKYLHSQLRAVPYYQRQGFKKEGGIFEEAGIEHYLMIKS